MSRNPHPHRSPAPSRSDGLTTVRVGGRARRAVRSLRHRGDEGVTLVEVLVASIVLLLTMIPMGMLLTSASTAAVQARQREAALQLADSWVEILANSQPPVGSDGTVLTNQPLTPTAPAGTQAPPSTLAGTTYGVTAEYTEALVTGSDLCSAGEPPSPSHPGVIQLRVLVTWGRPTQTISDSTDINYPKPGLQTEGFLAINVTNEGEPDVNGISPTLRLQAVPVTVTERSGNPMLANPTFTLYPDPNGCIFAQVPVGSYDIGVGQPQDGKPSLFQGYPGTPPFVSTADVQSESQTGLLVSVTAEKVVQLDAFDEGIVGTVSYGGASAIDSGVSCPGATSVTCVTTGSGPTGATAAWGGGSGTWSSTSLATGTHVDQVACTSATHTRCRAVGFGSSGGLLLSTGSDFNSVTTDTVPAGVTDVTQVVCPSTHGCYALGTTAAGPVLLAGSVHTSGDTWALVTPAGFTFTALRSIA